MSGAVASSVPKCGPSDLEAPFAKGSRSTVAELIDELPLGRFHVFHISRQILQNACVAATLEITPYIEAGIMAQFNVGGPEAFVSAFYAGSILGAALVSLQDSLGRRPVIRAGALAAVAFSFLIVAIPNYTMILVLRFLLGAGFSFQQFGFVRRGISIPRPQGHGTRALLLLLTQSLHSYQTRSKIDTPARRAAGSPSSCRVSTEARSTPH
jgi:hypothetical protein